jgi:hypothetical protein
MHELGITKNHSAHAVSFFSVSGPPFVASTALQWPRVGNCAVTLHQLLEKSQGGLTLVVLLQRSQ